MTSISQGAPEIPSQLFENQLDISNSTERSVVHFVEMIRDKHLFQIPQIFPPATLSKVETMNLVTASLQIFGTKDLYWMAQSYKLSTLEQKHCIQCAGLDLKDNIVMWGPVEGALFEGLKTLAEKSGVSGQFQEFCNRVGNYLPVLTVRDQNDTYIIRETTHEYVTEYRKRQTREHRPDILVFSVPDEPERVVLLSRFQGTQVIDYLNPEHLELVVDLAHTFSEDAHSTIDFNKGNLLVDQNRLFYIDKDLTHAYAENPRLDNFKTIFQNIRNTLHTQDEVQWAENYVKLLIRDRLDLSRPVDQEIYQKLFLFESLMEYIYTIDPSHSECMQTIQSIYPLLEQFPQEQAVAILNQLQIKIDQAIQFSEMMSNILWEEPNSIQQ